MKVLLTGGGTGGHITPLLAVAQKLKQLDPKTEVIYVGERGSKFTSMIEDQKVFDQQYQVFAGKFRRYHGESWLKRLFDVKTNFRNLRDMFYLLFGTVESWFLLRKLRPDVILLKGGFVGVPIGLAARRRIPLITHDSDALPGLANRLVSRWAVYHATGMPAKYYSYPKSKIKYVGVLVSDDYKKVSKELQNRYRKQLKLPVDALVLLITGGSSGAKAMNDAMLQLSPDLLESHPKLHIIHQTGAKFEDMYGNYQNKRLVVAGLLKNFYRYSGAADLIVTRAGANTIAEFGIQAKACIIVPNPWLTGGHQLKNAAYLADRQAAVIVDEDSLVKDQANHLKTAITDLLASQQRRAELGRRLYELAKPEAAQNLAELLLEVGSDRARPGGAGE